ncbi:MAG: gamma-glutamyltransferase, partial [Proteobacteria bacterium]|nr:gamma-glutamyltransferase [Pseudomonadota bacterium]
MTPTIVMKDGNPFLLAGASGGPRIISSVLNVVLGVIDFGMTLEQAMLHLRPHHQWRPDEVYFDVDPPASMAKKLTDRGHKLAKRHGSGVVQAILKT